MSELKEELAKLDALLAACYISDYEYERRRKELTGDTNQLEQEQQDYTNYEAERQEIEAQEAELQALEAEQWRAHESIVLTSKAPAKPANSQPTSMPGFAAMFGPSTPVWPGPEIQLIPKGPPPTEALETSKLVNNGREVFFIAVHPGSVLHVDLSNWTKETNNYGRPDEPTEAQKLKWKQEQLSMCSRLVKDNVKRIYKVQGSLSNVKYIGGIDISFAKNNKIDACACISVVEYPSLKVVYESFKMVKLTQPYIAGFLAFREVPHIMPLWNELKRTHPQFVPDLVIVDGNGINHMRGLGAACHLGIMIDTPTIGVAKQLLVCHGITPEIVDANLARSKGKPVEMLSQTNQVLGYAMHNSDGETIYISPGHKMDARGALEVVGETLNSRSIPEPVFKADYSSREFLRRYYSKFSA
eukprot:gene7840-9201_t